MNIPPAPGVHGNSAPQRAPEPPASLTTSTPPAPPISPPAAPPPAPEDPVDRSSEAPLPGVPAGPDVPVFPVALQPPTTRRQSSTATNAQRELVEIRITDQILVMANARSPRWRLRIRPRARAQPRVVGTGHQGRDTRGPCTGPERDGPLQRTSSRS